MTQWQPPHGQPGPSNEGPGPPPTPGGPVHGGSNPQSWPSTAELAKCENTVEKRKRIAMGIFLAVTGIVVGLLAGTC